MATSVELSALGFQAALTALLAMVHFALWRQSRGPYFASWAAAWAVYALRLACISEFLVTRAEGWLFAHQVATGVTALLLLMAALQFARGLRWRPAYLGLGLLVVAWAYVAIYVLHDMRTAGISAAVMLSAVTLWTGVVFFGVRGRRPTSGATVLAVTFTLWGLHHLDYPLLRALGNGTLYGVFADVLFIVAATVGTLLMVLGDGRRAVEERNRQLETLTHRLLRAQEDERRRIARELHDQAGQVLTAAKIQLDLEQRHEASALVGQALAQVRDLSNLLRPSALDDLGLVPALRALAEDFERHARIAVRLSVPAEFGPFAPETQVALYRVVQETLTNVARHAGAREVRVTFEGDGNGLRLVVADDGRGVDGAPVEHLGLLGIRERVTALGGVVQAGNAPGGGFRLEATLPPAAPAPGAGDAGRTASGATPAAETRPWGSRA